MVRFPYHLTLQSNKRFCYTYEVREVTWPFTSHRNRDWNRKLASQHVVNFHIQSIAGTMGQGPHWPGDGDIGNTVRCTQVEMDHQRGKPKDNEIKVPPDSSCCWISYFQLEVIWLFFEIPLKTASSKRTCMGLWYTSGEHQEALKPWQGFKPSGSTESGAYFKSVA